MQYSNVIGMITFRMMKGWAAQPSPPTRCQDQRINQPLSLSFSLSLSLSVSLSLSLSPFLFLDAHTTNRKCIAKARNRCTPSIIIVQNEVGRGVTPRVIFRWYKLLYILTASRAQWGSRLPFRSTWCLALMTIESSKQTQRLPPN